MHPQHVILRIAQRLGQVGIHHHVIGVPAMPCAGTGAREIDDHRAHHRGGIAEEVTPVLDRECLQPDELEVGLVHQRGGVQKGEGLMLAQARARQTTQIVIEQCKHTSQRHIIAAARRCEQPRQFRHFMEPPCG